MEKKVCWICEKTYECEHCPECGPPEPWGPTTDELVAAALAKPPGKMEDWEEGDEDG